MNIGIVSFPPGARPGALRLLREATAHLSENNNLRRVDQGPLNFRWKHGTGKWRWKRQLSGAKDATGKRLCALVNGTVRGGVLRTLTSNLALALALSLSLSLSLSLTLALTRCGAVCCRPPSSVTR